MLWTKRVVYLVYNKLKFTSGFAPFKLVEKKKLSEYFWASFWNGFFGLKREFFREVPRKCFKTTRKHSLAIFAQFEEKNSFVNIFPFYWFDQKQLIKQIQISSGFAPFQTF